MIKSVALQKLFINFMRSHLVIVDLSAHVISVLFRNLSPVLMHLRLFTTFSSIWFSLFDPLRLDFCAGWWIWTYLYPYTLRYAVWTSSFVYDTFFFSSVYLWLFFFWKSIRFLQVYGLGLCLQLDSMDQSVCFYAN